MQRLKGIMLQGVLGGCLLAAFPLGAQAQSAPVPGTAAAGRSPGAPSAYQQLPLSISDAQMRIDELKGLVRDGQRPQIADVVQQMGEWLADMAEAHQRLSRAFAKLEGSKAQSESEHQAAQKFASLKNQVMLLKAELLIRQSRYPEALGPLVDIVVAEPHSLVGKEAYKKLKEIGFSEALEVKTALPAESIVPVKEKIAPLPVAKTISTLKVPIAVPVKKVAWLQPAAKAVSKPPSNRLKIAAKPASKKTSRIIKGSPFGHY